MDNALKQNLMDGLGLNLLPEADREEALLRISNIIFKGVLMRVLDEMDEQQKDAFSALFSENPDDQEAIFAHLRSALPTFDDIVADEVANFTRESAQLL